MKKVNILGVGVVGFPDDMSDKEIQVAIHRDILPQAGIEQPESEGIIPALKSGLHGLGAQMAGFGVGAANMVGADSVRDYFDEIRKSQKLEAELDLPTPKTFDSVGKTYKDKGLLAAIPEGLRLAGETVASGLPQMAPMLLPVGGLAGAAIKGAGLFLPQLGANIGHQLDEGAAPKDVSMAKALPAAALQTALFAASEGMIAKPLNDAMGSIGLKAAMSALGKGAQTAAKEEASRKLAQVAADTFRHSIKGAAAQAVAMSGVSGIEHLQALQPGQEFGDKGWEEMKAGAAQGALFGGTVGAALGPMHGIGEAKQLAAKEALEANIKKAREKVKPTEQTGLMGKTGAALGFSGEDATHMTLPASDVAAIFPVEMMGESKIPKDSKPVEIKPEDYADYIESKKTQDKPAPGPAVPNLLDFMSIQMFGDGFRALPEDQQSKVTSAYMDKDVRKTYTGDLKAFEAAATKKTKAAEPVPVEESAPPANETPEAQLARLKAENEAMKKATRLSIVDDIRKSEGQDEVSFDLTDAETKKKIMETPELKAKYDSLHERSKPLFDRISQIFAGATFRYSEKGDNAGAADPSRGHVDVKSTGDAKGDIRTADHEGSHLVRPLMDPQEKKLLEAAAKRTGAFDVNREALYRERFKGLPEPEMKEMLGDEAAAHLIGAVSAGEVQLAGKPKNIIDRVKREAGKVSNLLEGLGYQDEADVYKRVQSGEIGNRRFYTPESKTVVAPVRTEEDRKKAAKISDSPLVAGEPDVEPTRLSIDESKGGEAWKKTLENFKAKKSSGDSYWEDAELVPTKELVKYREYDRPRDEKYPGHFNKVKSHISNNGITDMGILNYNPKNGKAYVGDGNTRISAAQELGIPYVPMRAMRWGHNKGAETPQQHPDAIAGRHVGSDINPVDLGFTKRDITKDDIVSGQRLSIPEGKRPTIDEVNSNINARNRMFHATSPELALKIMKSGEIRDIANAKTEEPGVSFSRVPRINQKTEPVVFSVDQSEVPSRTVAHKNFPKVKYDSWAKESYPNENFEFENRTKAGAVPMSAVKGIAIDESAVYPGDKFRINNLKRQATQLGIPVHSFANSDQLQSYRSSFLRDGVRLAIPEDKIKADSGTLDFARSVQSQAPLNTVPEKAAKAREGFKTLKENKLPEGATFTPREELTDKLRTWLLDRGQRIVRYEGKLGEMGITDPLLPENSAQLAFRQAEKNVAVADSGMTEGHVVFDKDQGITTILRDKDGKPVDISGKPAQGLLKAMAPILEMSPQDQMLTGFVAQARRLKTEPREKWGVFDEAAMAKADKLRKDNPHIDAALDGLRSNNESLVKFLVDTGVLTEKMANTWKAKDYTPMYRYIEENAEALLPHGSSSYKNLKLSAKFKGSDFQVNDMLENIVKNHYAAVSLGMRNVANNRIVRNAQLLGTAREVKGQTGPDIVSFRVDGQHRSFKIDDPLLVKAMSGLEELSPTITKVLSPASNWLRQGVTMSPTFWVSNITRDVFQNEFTSGRKIGNITTVVKGAGESAKAGLAVLRGKEQEHTPAYTALKDAGVLGGINIIGADGETKSNLMKEYSRLYEDLPPVTDASFLPKLLGRVIESAHAASERSDAVTREKVYTDALERTGSKAQALSEAMETLNFSRHGIHPFTRYLTMAVPFLNARVQGLDVLYRAAAGKSAHANPKQVQASLLKRGLAMASMVGAYSMLMPHYNAYNNANQEERDNYFFIPLYGDDKTTPMLRVPIPFEVGTIFKTVPERLWQYAVGHDSGDDLKKSMASNLMGTLAFNPIPQVAKPILEAQPFDEASPGWDSFRRRPVIERSTSSLKPEFQFGDQTSEVSKAIGKSIGVAPDKIDHIIQGYTGSMGAYMLELSSAIVNQFGDKVEPAKERYQSPLMMGLGKRFIQRPDSGGKINKFYDLADEVGKLVQTISVLQKQGRFDEMKALIDDPQNQKLMGVSDSVNQLKTQLGEIRGQRRLVMNDKTMSPEKKKEILDSFRGYEIQIASQIEEIKKVLK